jgi:hypothetical protein
VPGAALSAGVGVAWADEDEYVEEEAQAVEESADIYLKATDFDPDDDESGAAATSAESGRKPNILIHPAGATLRKVV